MASENYTRNGENTAEGVAVMSSALNGKFRQVWTGLVWNQIAFNLTFNALISDFNAKTNVSIVSSSD